MVLGQPIALVAKFLYMLRCFNAAANRCACSLPWPERYEIQNRKSDETHFSWMISEAKGRGSPRCRVSVGKRRLNLLLGCGLLAKLREQSAQHRCAFRWQQQKYANDHTADSLPARRFPPTKNK